ncbi:MAG: hypothetical protein ACRD2H_00490 [Terriglobales bacterium]
MTAEEAKEFFHARLETEDASALGDAETVARLREAYNSESRRAASPAEAGELVAAWRQAREALPPGERLAGLVERGVGDRLSGNSWGEVVKLLGLAVALTALLAAIFAGSRHGHWSRGATTALFCVAVAAVYFIGRRL